MRHRWAQFVFVLLLVLFTAIPGFAQKPNWMVGMRLGLSLISGAEEIETDQFGFARIDPATGQAKKKSPLRAGLQFGPTAEVIFNKNIGIVTEFNINTQSGTPIEWANLFKYYFMVSGSRIRPYADAGFSLYFVTGGPFVGIPFGGGALFPVSGNVYIPADIRFGPIFASAQTVFGITATTGVRFEL